MNKDEFLRQLEMLLSDVSAEERADAMAYYRSYFEDAGEGNESSIIEELESPQKVAESIKRDLGMITVAGKDTASKNMGQGTNSFRGQEANGRNTNEWNSQNQNGAGGGQNTYYSPNANRDAAYYKNVNDTLNNLNNEKKKDNTAMLVLGIVLAVVTCPVWIGILCGILGTVFGISIAVVSVTAALLITGFALVCAGIGCLAAASPVVGFGLIGAGLLVFTFGMLALIAAVWLFGGLFPLICKGIGMLFNKIFHSGKERVGA